MRIFLNDNPNSWMISSGKFPKHQMDDLAVPPILGNGHRMMSFYKVVSQLCLDDKAIYLCPHKFLIISPN